MQTIGYSASPSSASQSEPWRHSQLQVSAQLSFIRGYPAYKDIWEPFLGETLLLKRETTNVKDRSAVAVMNETEIQ